MASDSNRAARKVLESISNIEDALADAVNAMAKENMSEAQNFLIDIVTEATTAIDIIREM